MTYQIIIPMRLSETKCAVLLLRITCLGNTNADEILISSNWKKTRERYKKSPLKSIGWESKIRTFSKRTNKQAGEHKEAKQSGTGNRHYRRQRFKGMSHSTFGLSCPLNYFTGKPLRSLQLFLLNSLQFHRFQNVQPLTFVLRERKREHERARAKTLLRKHEKHEWKEFQTEKKQTKAMKISFTNKKMWNKSRKQYRWKQRKYYKFYYTKWKGDSGGGCCGGNINKTKKKKRTFDWTEIAWVVLPQHQGLTCAYIFPLPPPPR